MKYALVFHSEANLEFKKAINYYEEEQKGLGKRFQTVIEEKIEKILINQNSMPKLYPSFGKLLYKSFLT